MSLFCAFHLLFHLKLHVHREFYMGAHMYVDLKWSNKLRTLSDNQHSIIQEHKC